MHVSALLENKLVVSQLSLIIHEFLLDKHDRSRVPECRTHSSMSLRNQIIKKLYASEKTGHHCCDKCVCCVASLRCFKVYL